MEPEGPYMYNGLPVCDIPQDVIFFSPSLLLRGHDSSVGIEAGYDSGTDNSFSPTQRRDWLLGPLILVSNG
jgi:hypothetical protein